MPEIFEVACKNDNKNITIVCGDSFSRSYIVEDAVEVIFQSPSFDYQIHLEQIGLEWTLQFTPQQTQVVQEGTYNYQLKAKYENGTVKTIETAYITFLPSIFPNYRTYPVVMKDRNPEPSDTKFGVPTIWYNSPNKTMWVLEGVIGGVAKWRKTSNLNYIYQTQITEDFKFSGDTTIFSFIQVVNGTNLTILEGIYDPQTDKTNYNINLEGITQAQYYLYSDKSLEERPSLGTFEQEIILTNIVYKYDYIKDSLEKVKTLTSQTEAHIEDLDNPHEVTAEQVDTYIKTVIDAKDADTLRQAKDYTYSKAEIDNKDDAMVESGYYDEVANEIVLLLVNSSEIRIPAGNLLTDLDAHNIRFDGSGTNYLTAKTDVESALKELDTRASANDFSDFYKSKVDEMIAFMSFSVIYIDGEMFTTTPTISISGGNFVGFEPQGIIEGGNFI